ncbi:hypothetical protein Tco_1493154 [Tanacetum coccineum]
MNTTLPPQLFHLMFAELKDMGHSYQTVLTNTSIYHDNSQEYVSQAAAANFNQANSGYRPPMVSNQIRPPGFPPVQNPHANNQNNFNRGNNFNQNRGKQFQTKGRKPCNPDTEVTKDIACPPANNGSTKTQQLLLFQNSDFVNPNPEPNIAPICDSSIIQFSRRNDENTPGKANDQIEKFYEILRDLSFRD